MELITREDLNMITSSGGEEVNNDDHNKLKIVYAKLKHICSLLEAKGYTFEIRQDPRRQAGPGKFVFQDYQWAKIYPKEYYEYARDKFAYIVGFSDTVHFHLMGIKEYQHMVPSTNASKSCWTEIAFEGKNYDNIVNEFLDFDNRFRNLFIKTGADLGINDFTKILLQMKNEKIKDLLLYKKQIILQGPPGTGKTRQAKELAIQLLGLPSTEELKDNPQFKIIQFHPSYTYEDFVRGIVSQPNEDGDGILFKAENRVLADMAHVALQNYKASQNTPDTIISKDTFEIFIEKVKDEMAENELHQYPITNSVYLFSADETKFKYKGDNWDAHKNGLNMKFSELKLIIEYGAKERQDIKKMSDVEEKTRQHATYFMKVVEKYYEFEKNYQPETIWAEKVQLKNYVLVIDEINRANLSSVLGELIYALEYRGKAVESMYALEDATNESKNKLILPPNLYIIGTMNTADRSVGHIDYAIRRRFAFVDVLPEPLEDDEHIHFNNEGFKKVSELFKNGNVSGEFDAKDVQLGHSYFIAKKEDIEDGQTKEEIFRIKMNYEVVPILLEYVKDGVLIGSHDGKDIKDYINTLKINN
ncbi:AAA family ATPase [Chryseobacterium sp. S0630]|uniref:McrB family protein n=1 Tax=Chryseobacterium sp. S0630 TaxID=2957803 RepID=UPI00209CBCA2|nr:AAA family ATPase [Chryseobacterium sp. S0630]MCP1299436.1 AAA family ATPase [Chryseobacterium sp. S0630]